MVVKDIARAYAQSELQDNHAPVEVIVAAAFENGIDYAQHHPDCLWRDAHSNDLPEIEREVVVLIQDWKDEEYARVAFGHRPNPKGWTGKNLSTGKIEHYTPKTFGKGGWNLANVKYWLDVELPIKVEK